eukprot:scaffold202273_cov19-Tisochrysis_lutea.AAC.1
MRPQTVFFMYRCNSFTLLFLCSCAQIVIGGTNQNAEMQRIRRRPPQILVATPGRCLDHLTNNSPLNSLIVMLGPFHHEFAPKCVQVNTGNVWSTSGSHCHSKLWCLDHLSGKAPLSKSAAAGVGCAAAASARCPCLSDRICLTLHCGAFKLAVPDRPWSCWSHLGTSLPCCLYLHLQAASKQGASTHAPGLLSFPCDPNPPRPPCASCPAIPALTHAHLRTVLDVLASSCHPCHAGHDVHAVVTSHGPVTHVAGHDARAASAGV